MGVDQADPTRIGVGAHWMGGVRLGVSRLSSGIGWISERESRRKEAPCGWLVRGWRFCPLIFNYFNGRAELLSSLKWVEMAGKRGKRQEGGS